MIDLYAKNYHVPFCWCGHDGVLDDMILLFFPVWFVIVHWSAAPHHSKEFYFITIFIMIAVTIIGIFMVIFILNNKFRFSLTKYFLLCKCKYLDVSTPGHSPWISNWICYLGTRYLMVTFPTRIFYREVPEFATDCPCGVWCRGWTTCLLYVGPLYGNLV